MKASFHFNSCQNTLESLHFASTFFSSPAKHCSPCTSLPRALLLLHIASTCALLPFAPGSACTSLSTSPCLHTSLLAHYFACLHVTGSKTVPLAHHLQSLVSSICFYCPLLGTAKGTADPSGTAFTSPSPSAISGEPQAGVPEQWGHSLMQGSEQFGSAVASTCAQLGSRPCPALGPFVGRGKVSH